MNRADTTILSYKGCIQLYLRNHSPVFLTGEGGRVEREGRGREREGGRGREREKGGRGRERGK